MIASWRGDPAPSRAAGITRDQAPLLRADGGLPRGVRGAADSRCANVVRVFAGLFPGRFGGGTLCVYIDGGPVVDVWTGWPDRAGEVPQYGATYGKQRKPVAGKPASGRR